MKCWSISSQSEVSHPVWEQLGEEKKGSVAHHRLWTKTWNCLLPNPTLYVRLEESDMLLAIIFSPVLEWKGESLISDLLHSQACAAVAASWPEAAAAVRVEAKPQTTGDYSEE